MLDKTTKDIAQQLFISEKTVRNHISNVIQKLGVKGRSQAVVELVPTGRNKNIVPLLNWHPPLLRRFFVFIFRKEKTIAFLIIKHQDKKVIKLKGSEKMKKKGIGIVDSGVGGINGCKRSASAVTA